MPTHLPRLAKIAIVAAFLATNSAAFDIQYCHGGYTSGFCQEITLSSAVRTCYPLNISSGAIDAVVGITAGITYTLYTDAGCTGNATSVFALGNNTLTPPFLNNVLSLAAQLPFVSPWQSLGCYTDTAGGRTLAALSTSTPGLTAESCQTYCSSNGYTLAGVEYGNECYCDYSIHPPGVLTDLTSCDVPCDGDALQKCGGPNRINIFWNGKPGPTNAATIGGGTFAYSGCYTDDTNPRALPARYEIEGGATPDTCATICNANNYTITGLEYGLECWCGNLLSNTSAKVTNDECGMACKANTTSYCGDAYRLNVWSKSL